jgi:hypothetical protein
VTDCGTEGGVVSTGGGGVTPVTSAPPLHAASTAMRSSAVRRLFIRGAGMTMEGLFKPTLRCTNRLREATRRCRSARPGASPCPASLQPEQRAAIIDEVQLDFDLETGKVERYFAGPAHGLQECSFIPRGSGIEGDDYLIADAQRPGEGDMARVILPLKISQQVHGVWADAKELAL